MRLPYFSLLFLALVSACERRDPVADQLDNDSALPAPQVANASDPSGAAPPPNSENPPTPVTSGSTAAAAAIPAMFHGRWGLAPADCTSNLGDAKGLLVIGPDRLTFYESRAVPAGNVETSEDSFSADFAFTGEGQSWTRFQSLELQKGGKLVRTESGPMASYTYAKCR